MKTYVVGGAVRDALLGRPVQDRDHVVVGATPADMVRDGFKPVGRDFPVFLHPQTHEEYALARTERKTAPGYHGFQFHAAPDVTLEQDLARRDLTVNAIAQDEHGRLIDPHGGVQDLRAGILRHVGPAFVEDPVRILRVARFAARYAFAVAPETMRLMQAMVQAGEADALVPERVWQEFSKGLLEAHPDRMFSVLEESGAMLAVLPQWASIPRERALAALAHAAVKREDLVVRYACLFAGCERVVAERAAEHLRTPADCRELAVLAATCVPEIAVASRMDAAGLVALLQRGDAWRRPERFEALLRVFAYDARAQHGAAIDANTARLRRALAATLQVDAGAIARSQPSDIAMALNAARIAAVQAALKNTT